MTREALGRVVAVAVVTAVPVGAHAGPEAAGWYAGDMHVHRSCGGSPEAVSSLFTKMAPNDLAAISLLADMGNGEVQNATTDLPLVNGQDASVSTSSRIVHWDSEWHWDAIYTQYPHQALGGHIVALGTNESHQIWQEYTYPIFSWAHQAGGIAGFAHMQYLDYGIPQTLSCCGPIEYPVEVALGSSDFISEDVVDVNTSFGGMDPEAATSAYYRLLNCGFRPGFAAGTDYPCNSGRDLGGLLTYSQVAGGQMSYRGWVDGIAKGRTVVSRNGHNEFLNLAVNGSAGPGDEVALTGGGSVSVSVTWTANQALSGTIELVSNGAVVASKQASVTATTPATLTATVPFTRSGWLAARRMGSSGHQVHTSAVFVIVDGKPIRASVTDANFYVAWMDNLLQKTAPGGAWNSFFPTSLAAAQARYQAARTLFQQIAAEAAAAAPPPTSSGTLWPDTTTPSAVDTGPDSAVELGVKFRSDVNGYVTGVRFYKAAANTGTHVGNLWSASGALLASATFTGETASGWQQVNFASPVPVTAGAVYVASYHTDVGHYSDDVGYFSGKGLDSPPLHALADGTSGVNGVYAYGPGGIFPSLGWQSSNYWVDVAFKPAAALSSIAVAPATATISSGATAAFTATGTFADGSTQALTSLASWSSGDGTVATVAAGGIATGGNPGTTTVTATYGGVTGSATLTVQPVPLAVTTSSLATGTIGGGYSATLAASGGVKPYTWAIASGLPPGLALNASTGTISGTPTAAGTYPFTARVTDAAGGTASRALAITVSAAVDTTIFGARTPTIVDGATTRAAEVGVKFRSDVAGSVKGIRFYKAAANTGTHVASLWTSAGSLLARGTFSGETASGWQQVMFAAPVAMAANTIYVASYHTNVGHYSADARFFASAGVDSPPLHAVANTVSANGVFINSSTSRFPTSSSSSTNYWVDVVFSSVPPPALASIAVAPAAPTLQLGGTQQLTATGTYTDGSTRDLTSSATWASSSTAVATVSSAGLVTAVKAGTTTVSATSGSVSGSTVVTVASPPLAITTSSLPGGTAWTAYSATLAGSGGAPPYSWSISGALPAGLSLTAATGAISGTPTAVGTSSFTIVLTDAGGQSVTRAASIAIAAPPALVLATSSLPDATRGVLYGASLSATGGAPPYAWSIAGGLPAGMALNASTGVITGISSSLGTFGFTAQVMDNAGQVTTRTLSISVIEPPALSIPALALPTATRGMPYAAPLSASGGVPPLTWSVPAGLPPGLSIAAGTGVVSGTPTAVGAYTFNVQVTDTVAQTATRALTINVLPPSNYSIWPGATLPAIGDSGPDSAVELGVKFRADVAGTISAIRFYKASTNTGTHVGNLWSSGGTRLASATFTGETASGWQQVNFGTPVAIAANTVYVASYHTNAGHYADDQRYFQTAVDNPPLHALADGASGVNGVFAYGSSSSFPSQGWNASNYWVDVVFTPTAPLATLTAIAVAPANPTLTGISTAQLTATGTYSDGTTQDVTRTVVWASSNAAVAVVDAGALVTTQGFGSAVVSATLTGVSGATTITVVPPPPPPDEGPGGPILVVSSAVNPFSRYYAEILKAEGLNEFTAKDIGSVTAATLADRDVVILGDFSLTADQVALFTGWVNAGGSLIAMRPDGQLAGLLGISPTGQTLSNGYVLVNTAAPPGAGIVGETVQFHGMADLYALSGATSVATLYSSASLATSSPAVTLRPAGAGLAAAFTYDLARSVVYTRQGNPVWSGQERDGTSPMRSDDLFFGPASSDPQPDWVDFTKIQIPQADEQQRLLANLILRMNAAKKPLPRFWYLPSGFKAAVVMTGDDHGNGGTLGRFDRYVAASSTGCSVDDWQCVRSTSYVYAPWTFTAAQAQQYTANGFEIALHVTTGCADWDTYAALESFYATQLAGFTSFFNTIPAPSTNRTHCIVWSDFDSQPKVELAHGIRLDTSYYYWPGSWIADRPGLMTGSGLPMRFADRGGQTIDVYQAATQMTDESDQTYPLHVNTLLDNALGAKGYYGVFTANMHTDQVSSPGSDAIVASARTRGVPVVSARQMLTWLDGRDRSAFGALSWSGGVLSFGVTVAGGARNIRAMLPASFGGLTLSAITRAGAAVPFTTETIKGVSYAVFAAGSDSYQATYR